MQSMYPEADFLSVASPARIVEKQEDIVALSTAESEYVALSGVCMDEKAELQAWKSSRRAHNGHGRQSVMS